MQRDIDKGKTWTELKPGVVKMSVALDGTSGGEVFRMYDQRT